MTDKEFKRLSRSQLIEIIYQLQLKQEELIAENEKLSKALEDKRILLVDAGNVAEAALGIHKVMQVAQDAATHYLEEMRLRGDEAYQQILQKAKDDAAALLAKAQQETVELALILQKAKDDTSAILAKAQQEAAELVLKANNAYAGSNPVAEASLKE